MTWLTSQKTSTSPRSDFIWSVKHVHISHATDRIYACMFVRGIKTVEDNSTEISFASMKRRWLTIPCTCQSQSHHQHISRGLGMSSGPLAARYLTYSCLSCNAFKRSNDLACRSSQIWCRMRCFFILTCNGLCCLSCLLWVGLRGVHWYEINLSQ